MEYRSSFFLQAFGMAISNGTFVFFWWIAFTQIGGHIGGYDFKDVMFIWALTSSAFGASNILFANMTRITSIIVSGELDTFLLQPKDALISLLCSRTALSAWGDLIYGFVLMALTQGSNGMAWLMFLIGIVIGGLLMTAVSVTAHTFAFYFGDASLFGGMALEFIINFCIYPEGIYRGVVRVLMLSVIPASFIVHMPLKLARSFDPVTLIILLAFSALYCFMSYKFFYHGLKKYESGNLIITRM
jgi:ABC-2 type transport system permease protein